jgi:GTP pyrophosphokinase
VDIAHIDMGQQTAQVTVELHFVVTVRDVAHLTQALLNLNRSSSVIRAERIKSPNPIK